MKWCSTQIALFPLLALLAIGLFSTVSAQKVNNVPSVSTTMDLTGEDPETVNKANLMIQEYVNGATFGKLVDDMQKINLTKPIRIVAREYVVKHIADPKNPNVVAFSNVTISDLTEEPEEKLTDFMNGGLSSCFLFHDTMQNAGQSRLNDSAFQQAVNDQMTTCIFGNGLGPDSLMQAGEKLIEATRPFREQEELKETDKQTLEKSLVALTDNYTATAAAEKKQAEEQPRLLKRGFVGNDILMDDRTKQQTGKLYVARASKVAQVLFAIVAFKFAVGVSLKNVFKDAGFDASGQIIEKAFSLKKGKAAPVAVQMLHEDVEQLVAAGHEPFPEAGVYVISGVPAKSAYGGGPDLSLYPQGAVPMFRNVCENPLAAQKWQVGTTIHLASIGTPNWCRSTVLLHIEERKGALEVALIPNLETSRKSVGHLSTLIRTFFGLPAGYTMRTIGLMMWLGLGLVTSPVSLFTAIPMMGLAYHKTTLLSLPASLAAKVKGYAVAAAKGRAWNSLPAGLRQMYSVGDWFRVGSLFGKKKKTAVPASTSATKAAAKAADAPPAYADVDFEDDEDEDDEEDIFDVNPEEEAVPKYSPSTLPKYSDYEELNGDFNDDDVDYFTAPVSSKVSKVAKALPSTKAEETPLTKEQLADFDAFLNNQWSDRLNGFSSEKPKMPLAPRKTAFNTPSYKSSMYAPSEKKFANQDYFNYKPKEVKLSNYPKQQRYIPKAPASTFNDDLYEDGYGFAPLPEYAF